MKQHHLRSLLLVAFVSLGLPAAAEPLPGTQPLTLEGDLASQMIDGIDRFLLDQLQRSVAGRASHWNRDVRSATAYVRSLEPNRQRLAWILGVRDSRVAFDALELNATTGASGRVGEGHAYEIFAVRWPVLADPDPNRQQVVVHGEGLLLVPRGDTIAADIVAIPDADQTPEQLCGLAEGVPRNLQFARRMAEAGCRVIVPALISRRMERRSLAGRGRGANLTNREFVYRPAFELGRHLIGYEVQKALAAVDWFQSQAAGPPPEGTARRRPTGVIGYGEGGMLALYAAALDPRIDAACVLGFFGPLEDLWQQPLDRNVFGLLEQFGAAELATMVLPRPLIVQDSPVPEVRLPGEGGAPAVLRDPPRAAVAEEVARTEKLVWAIGGERVSPFTFVTAPREGESRLLADSTLCEFLYQLDPALKPKPRSSIPEPPSFRFSNGAPPRSTQPPPDAAVRQRRQVDELDLFNQLLLRESPFVRKEFFRELDTSSLEAFRDSVERYREIFRDEVIGRFDLPRQPFNARSRKTWETASWTGYEVVLDVWPDVFAYGVLLVPNDLPLEGPQRRPVVVCQHGLEGRPTDTFLGDHRAYHNFAAQLAERGFVTFAPQNPYIFEDRFRTLQRKANPLGKTLFSIIVPQHQQIVDWLQSLPFVDPQRIGFYGLSYGGKTAMRVPALVTDYCLSICSADFNEWVRKNASSRHPFSYVWTKEYEIFEFDLGSRFNYAEMATLICPRPFMVERGHFDGVGWDEWVAYEYAKVRHLYQAELKLRDRTEIEWFDGPHAIHGQATFDFLQRHLRRQ